jgi:Putative auto-transporter adhesin, head GIN domain
LDIENNKRSLTFKNITTMKKTILTAAIALSVVFGISRSANAATGSKTETATVLSDVKNISEIEVHGNVQVFLTTGDEQKVKVYNNYYNEDALVQEQNGVLRITSYNTEKLVVWVTVSDLSSLSAYDNAEVKSFGKFSAIDLKVTLHNHALAQLNMDAINASVTLTERSRADLSGSAENGKLVYDGSAFMNAGNFTAAHLTKTIKFQPMRHPHPVQFASL